ncbi:MAG: biosynthetic-type acetolactate synthase large subunit [Candidatus Dormibacteraeota bacterium]|nr:biosynthetic-type acetolactate synthase large subunit [Candidatus Dormibacteraeota bacterium]MBV9525719.1 biosynthetic-type acetolactate synthase large subunit [Candidatus Dormibacteraeota bacterium]
MIETAAVTPLSEVASRRLTGAQIALETLVQEGVDTIFGYPGGANLWLYRWLPAYPQLRHVLVRHEQGGAHAADGYARSKRGAVGVVFATSGPGALNLVTGLATAYMDSVPVVAITGQVPSTAIGTDSFQESDVIGSTMSVVKHSYLITSVDDVAPVIREAFHVARTGRPGPVLIDFPKDLQAAATEHVRDDTPVRLRSYLAPPPPDSAKLRRVAQLIRDARRPVILAGRGVIIAQAEEELIELAHLASIPVGWTLLGTGAFPLQDPLALQMVGFMGAGYTNKAVCDADLLIMVGMRCDDRVTTRLDSFAPRVEHLVHIDIDPAEIGKNVVPHVSLVSDAGAALRALIPLVEPKREHEWLTQIDQWREEHPVRYMRRNGLLQPQEVLEAMYARCNDEAIVLADVGQNQIWAALWFNYARPGTFINSGGTGTMGYAFPASMGVKLANPSKTVFCVTGEGGFVMNMQEMATMVENDIDVTVVILNNASLGMVRQFQDDFYDGVRSAVDLTFTPDFVKLGEAFGMKAMTTGRLEDVGPMLDAAVAHRGPVLLNFDIDPEANVYPIVPLGKGMLDFVEAS